MSRIPMFSSPLMLGFEDLERLLDRATKSSGDGYPPYNIERLTAGDSVTAIRITLAVAGFAASDIEITLEDNQLSVRGRQDDDETRIYLHRGIAGRQFQRNFVLADGIEVRQARLENGLLSIDLERPEPKKTVRKIEIQN